MRPIQRWGGLARARERDGGPDLNGRQKSPGRLVLPTLFLTRFIMGTPGIVCARARYGMSASSSESLNLEQVPSFRGTMMSLSSATASIGSALGVGLGGLIILRYGYGILGVVLGLVGVAAGGIFHFLVSDPTRT